MKKMLPVILAAVLLLCMAGCVNKDASTTPAESSDVSSQAQNTGASEVQALNAAEMFTERDKDASYDENASTQIILNGSGAQCSADAVQITGNTVTVTDAGTYLISGTLDAGMIVVDAEKTDKVQLVLRGVSVQCETSAAIYVKQADKVFLTLAAGTENAISSTGEFVALDDNNIDAAIFSKEDFTLNGSGALTVNAAYGHGIVSKDDLAVTGGTYVISVAGHGFAGKNSVRVAQGAFTITSGKDGIHAENADDTTLGFTYIADGTFHIDAQTDGIDAAAVLQIDGGDFHLKTGGGSQNASTAEDGGFNAQWGNWGANAQETAAKTSSAKGLKAGKKLVINNGDFKIDSSDDALHADGDVTISGGDLNIASGDDGVHADAQVTICGGTIVITKSYEGIEGQSIVISGGNSTLTSSDDGLNAAGGNDQSGMGARPGMDNFDATSDIFIRISGGVLVINAEGDGIDSNGDLYVTGGETYVSGPTNNGNGALDYDAKAQITGGVLIAAGFSGMAQNFGDTSTQGSILVTLSGSQPGGSEVVLTDNAGNKMAAYTPQKQYNCVVISCPGIVQGSTYQLTAGTATTSVTMSSIIFGSGSAGQMGGGAPGGKR